MTDYERLSFLDNTFLAMEGPTNPMHVGATLSFAPGGLATADGGVDIDSVRAFIGNRLQYVPRYRQRLEWIPIERHPVWVDDAHFDLTYHVRHTALPRPGTEEQLRMLAGRILSQRLDRNRPLWEVWVVEGLADGGFALVSKVHHCMIDGLSGVDLLKVLLAPFPSDDLGEPDDFRPRPAPTPARLLGEELGRRMRSSREAVREARRFARESRLLGDEARQRIGSMVQSARSGWLTRASETPLNPHIGPNRRVDFLVTDLEEVKKVKNALGGTVNDTVIAAVSGAVRSFLVEERGFDVEGIDFRAMVPVSTRDGSGADLPGNAVTMWLVPLPIDLAGARERHAAVVERTTHLKVTDQATGAALLTQSASFTPSTLLSLAARVAAATIRPFNLTVTNVPGPQVPLHLLSARLRRIFPMVPLWVNHGLGVALFSYDGTLNWGLVSDFDSVPDIDRFAGHLRRALDELLEAAG
ncbi:MAG: wax ester/triacylglycerol synthase family O-acyltransferase [Acidimicrobiia bacterium]|nr:MAG: wax ester/triacylglycerol synthase family O-acyltransferase [Acidimicrobiia bacterium]